VGGGLDGEVRVRVRDERCVRYPWEEAGYENLPSLPLLSSRVREEEQGPHPTVPLLSLSLLPC